LTEGIVEKSPAPQFSVSFLIKLLLRSSPKTEWNGVVVIDDVVAVDEIGK
jgi:hypothetical protein